VEASDEASNPDDRARSSELVSEPFLIDHTPPQVEVTDVALADGVLRARARIRDASGAVERAEVSVDGGSWRPVLPEDAVFDESEEVVPIEIEDLDGAEHTLVVRAEDSARNVGSGRGLWRGSRSAGEEEREP
jgi:hypothetical protein